MVTHVTGWLQRGDVGGVGAGEGWGGWGGGEHSSQWCSGPAGTPEYSDRLDGAKEQVLINSVH